jgi:DNA mismatch repair ATPase MutS
MNVFVGFYNLFFKKKKIAIIEESPDPYLVSLYFKSNKRDESKYYVDTQTSKDLDLFNVFLKINYTNSKIGQQYLYNTLRVPSTNINELLEQNKLTEFFSINKDLSLSVQNELGHLNEEKDYRIISFICSEPIKKPKFFYLVYCSQISLFFFLGMSFFYPAVLVCLLPIFFFNFFIHYKTKEYFWSFFANITEVSILHKCAATLLKHIPWFEESINIEIKKTKKFINKASLFSPSKLGSSDLGQVFLLAVQLFRILILLDVYYTYSLASEIEKYKKEILSIYRYVGKIDMGLSVALYRETLPAYSLPIFVEGRSRIKFENICHPLIKDCQANNIDNKSNLIFINGSNMSGKTTFIRTIGINILLARSIYTCLATKAEISFFNTFSSIKIEDDILDGSSFYFSELLRFKQFIELSGSPTSSNNLFLIDEILKGTNVNDRNKIAKSILQYLQKNKNSFMIVTSHDKGIIEELENDIDRFHFKDEVIKNKLVFDYKIRDGLSIHTNAVELLNLLDFPTEVIDNAS